MKLSTVALVTLLMITVGYVLRMGQTLRVLLDHAMTFQPELTIDSNTVVEIAW
jgi:hypothetical protein